MLMQGKTVLITGGGSGIGAAVARDIVAEGGAVVITGRRREPLDAVVAELGDRAVALHGDAGLAADMAAAVSLAAQRFSPINAAIACAGVMGATAVADTSDDDWAALLHGNLTTMFVTARASLPTLIEQRGAFVAVASVAALVALPQSCAYTASKHAMIGLMRSMAVDYGPRGVRVNAVCPGWVTTPMADDHMALVMEREGCSLEEAYRIVNRDVPLRQPATPAEVAQMCTFLASDRANAMTGSVVTVDGGTTSVCAGMLRVH